LQGSFKACTYAIINGTDTKSIQRISGSEHNECGRLLFKELLLNVLFIIVAAPAPLPPPLTLLLLLVAERQLSSAFNSAQVTSLSDSGVSRDTALNKNDINKSMRIG